jgi:hypothetical protein
MKRSKIRDCLKYRQALPKRVNWWASPPTQERVVEQPQILVVRTDLKMTPGKIAAQCVHPNPALFPY